ncbi:hypothetical protein HNP86_000976 [Methanococcus maripaludis]|uniref:Uncharacterized protein n=1 Tax=Methanococcus maripaludis TaxID=39152 RepID=A0A7J9NU59_METMI|nr:hypothetical protein [Methanococcus maripaludis]MBA2850845.1 hypothetical protein [Methanococcus maripaludis]
MKDPEYYIKASHKAVNNYVYTVQTRRMPLGWNFGIDMNNPDNVSVIRSVGYEDSAAIGSQYTSIAAVNEVSKLIAEDIRNGNISTDTMKKIYGPDIWAKSTEVVKNISDENEDLSEEQLAIEAAVQPIAGYMQEKYMPVKGFTMIGMLNSELIQLYHDCWETGLLNVAKYNIKSKVKSIALSDNNIMTFESLNKILKTLGLERSIFDEFFDDLRF